MNKKNEKKNEKNKRRTREKKAKKIEINFIYNIHYIKLYTNTRARENECFTSSSRT